MNRNKFKKIILSVSVIAIIFVGVTSLFFIPKSNVNAQIGGIKIPTLKGISSLLPGSNNVPTNDVKGNFKEFTLDSIFLNTAKVSINVLTESIVNWINRGFDGNPAFVDDFGGFLREVADRETAQFIEGTALELLCSPWRANIKVALSLPTGYREEVACTLSDIVANMDNFVKGDFRQGGWGGWFQLTTRPNNNPYSLYISSASELDSRIANQQGIDREQLAWGQGFFSKRECEELPAGVAGPPSCKIVTPGSMINTQLEKVLNTSLTQLELADEFNEIISALASQLMTRVISGRGLRSLSESVNGTTSYVTKLAKDENGLVLSSNKAGVASEIDTVVVMETQYNNSKRQTFNTTVPTESLLVQLQSCYESKLNNLALHLTTAERDLASERMASASSTINSQIIPVKTRLSEEINVSNEVLAQLQALIDEVNGVNISSKLLDILARYQDYIGSGVIHTTFDPSDIDTQNTMNSIESETEGKIIECQDFPPPPVPVIPPTT
ncbi:hypothetical protein HON59_02850 [bacterium]|jgi:hypothetical protein|nr:hypothetical protein [bacterium]MBT4894970.1 hypothetical protein [bacterium]